MKETEQVKMMDAVKKVGVFALALMALASAIPITANAAGEAPAIILSTANGSISFLETNAGDTNACVNVQLTVPPIGGPVTVVLEVTRGKETGDSPLPVLSQYEIPFKNGQTNGTFYFSELDGTAESEMSGFRVNAYIKETTPSAIDPSKTWREIYQPGEFQFFVRNVAPQIVAGFSYGDELTATVGEPLSITWSVNDTPADIQGMRATWTTLEAATSMTLDPSLNVYTNEFVFTSAGFKYISLIVEDKDGGMDTFFLNVNVRVPDDRQKELIGDYTWSYRIQNGGAVIAGLMDVPSLSPSPEGALNIPPELGGCPVVSIEDGAFYGCENLTSVTIPSSVTNIGYRAFADCSGLVSVAIPSSVTSIGEATFYGCSALTSVTIPSRVTSIGFGAFYGCSGLNAFVVDADNPVYCSLNGLLCSKDDKELISGVNGDVTIPEGVTSIGQSAFEGCSGLTSVVIPSSVTSIGFYAFSGCSGLASVTISDGVTRIDGSAFEGCSGLTSVVIPSSVTSIGFYAFRGCSGLTSVTISDGVTRIDGSAFEGCSGLTSVVIPSSVTSIGTRAFSDCSCLTSVTIPLSMPDFKYVFQNCSSLTSVTISEGVTSIGNYAFQNCSGLTSVTIPSSVTSIGNYAFQNCSGLTSVTIPSSVTSIGKSAFSGCSGLTSVTIPSSVTSIGNIAFRDCSGMTSVTISEGVTSIGDYAFQNCIGLTSVTIPSSVTSIGNDAFRDCSGMTSVTISEGVTSIGDYAFQKCIGLTSVTIPSSVTSIGNNAFRYCSGMTSVTLSSDINIRMTNVFADSHSLTSVTISEGVTSIGDYAFQNCIGLTSVTIPSSVTSIGNNAFQKCIGLTSVTIPSSVTSIGNNAFRDCSGMTSVALPSSVTNIGYYAFYDCERLSTVYVEKGDAARVRGLLEGSRSYLDWDSISFVEDWVRVDETVILTSAEIEAEMVKYPTLAALAGNDVEAFAKLPSAVGKVDAAGNQMHVWQDIVAGTDPTDPDDQFKVTAIVMENGEIKVTWSPDLNENGTKNVRRYIQYGSKTIGGSAAWVDLSTVPAAEQNDYKFRKVTVGMP